MKPCPTFKRIYFFLHAVCSETNEPTQSLFTNYLTVCLVISVKLSFMNSHLGIWWITAKLSQSWPPRIYFKGSFRTFNSCRMLKQMFLNCWHSLVNKVGSLITEIRKYIDLLFFKRGQFSIFLSLKAWNFTKFQFWNFKEGQYLRLSSLRYYVLWSCWRLCCW